MNRSLTTTVVAGAIVMMTSTFAVAARETALTKVAADLGFAYSYLGPEDAAALTRPGVTVVIRPGERLFDVNDRTEAMNGAAPRFAYNDIFISDALVARLRQLAARYPGTVGIDRMAQSGISTPVAAPASFNGSITKLAVAQIPGTQEISVGGVAPANAPITLTLVGTFSAEVPDVVLNRRTIAADRDGTFQTNVPIASGFYRGGILTLVASSTPGVKSARAQLSVKAPNAAVSIPADSEPKSIK